MINGVTLAFMLTLFAGLATGIGSLLAFMTDKSNRAFLSISLAFSAGVMVYISFMRILPEAGETIVSQYGPGIGEWVTAGSFFLGVLLAGVIDKLVPEFENPHHSRDEELISGLRQGEMERGELRRMGLFSAAAIVIHNFPEGMATYTSALTDPALGISIALAVAIHNIPEGVSVAVPIYYSTGSRKKAFAYSFLSGLAEPLGALAAYLFLRSFSGLAVFGIVIGATAGIMVYISIDELLPAARKYGKGHQEIYGFIAGMAVIAFSLLVL